MSIVKNYNYRQAISILIDSEYSVNSVISFRNRSNSSIDGPGSPSSELTYLLNQIITSAEAANNVDAQVEEVSTASEVNLQEDSNCEKEVDVSKETQNLPSKKTEGSGELKISILSEV